MNRDRLSVEAATVDGVVVPAGLLAVAQDDLGLGDASHLEVGAFNLLTMEGNPI